MPTKAVELQSAFVSLSQMSHQFVPVDPTDVFVDMDPIFHEDSQFTRSLTSREQYVWEPCDSEKLPETLASGIQRFLRVANLVESEEPRIAYLCRFYTFEEAHRIDPTSTGRGVRQFKNSLLRRLEKDDEFTARIRKVGDDSKELKRVYDAYLEYLIRHGAAFNLDNSQREKLIDACRIASVLYEVLKAADTSCAYAAAPESILLNRDEETGELLVGKAELIVDKCKASEEGRQTHISQGDDSIQSNHLTQTDINAIHKDEVQIKEDRMFANGLMGDDVRPSSAVPSFSEEDKYLEIQEKLNKVEKKIEEIDLKLKDVDFCTNMMKNMFPDQVPPSMRANQTENSKKKQ